METSEVTESAVQVKSQVLYVEPAHFTGRVAFGDDYSGQSQITVPVSQGAKESDSSETEPIRRKKLVKCLSNSEISSQERQLVVRSQRQYTQRQYLKPPKFDGSIIAFDSFLIQFQNCATFNKWNKAEQLAFLRVALDKEAARVL